MKSHWRKLNGTTQEIKLISSYRMTNADINDAIAFINSGNDLIPAAMNARQRARMNQKIGAGTDFVVGGGKLRYNLNPNINLPIAQPLQIPNIL